MRDLAPYACDPAVSRGRRHAESEDARRSPFQRDRDRILHSTAFRRLMHKTQVFVAHEGDHYRTRLTHSLEVAQIARTLARTLRLDEDLAEAVALAHDLGHTPFGHAGEHALDAAMRDHGGFDHNAQALRVVTRLERRYAGFDGLNLTWETLEGLVKHNGPVPEGAAPWPIRRYAAQHDLWLWSQAGTEAQLAALSDDIAYNVHDLDDGLRAGFFAPEDLSGLPLVGEMFGIVDAAHPGLEAGRRQHEALRRLFAALVDDVLTETRRRIAVLAPAHADDIRRAEAPVVAFSGGMQTAIAAIQRFLFARMYRHPRVAATMRDAETVVADLFALFVAEPSALPADWRDAARETADDTARARVVADYIAGMTDRFALDEHRRLCGPHGRAGQEDRECD